MKARKQHVTPAKAGAQGDGESPRRQEEDGTLYSRDIVAAAAALEALLDREHDRAQELLAPLSPAQLRRLALVAQDLAHLARAASLRPYLFAEELAGLGRE